MKTIIVKLNKVFESRVRLGIMSMLVVNDEVDFNTLKKMLDVTDGNLASHINALEKQHYLSVNKDFVGKKTRTSFTATREGRDAFSQHLNALEELIKSTES